MYHMNSKLSHNVVIYHCYHGNRVSTTERSQYCLQFFHVFHCFAKAGDTERHLLLKFNVHNIFIRLALQDGISYLIFIFCIYIDINICILFCDYLQHFGNNDIPEISCSNALEGLLHHFASVYIFSQKQLPRKMKSRLVIIECAGYIFWQWF